MPVLAESWELLIGGWLQEALGGPQELPKFYCLNKNFKVMK